MTGSASGRRYVIDAMESYTIVVQIPWPANTTSSAFAVEQNKEKLQHVVRLGRGRPRRSHLPPLRPALTSTSSPLQSSWRTLVSTDVTSNLRCAFSFDPETQVLYIRSSMSCSAPSAHPTQVSQRSLTIDWTKA